ncbi:MAG: Fic family protein [Peptostreptococcaceae bacterium]|nr:Fic family protein [Peptostreptococcaceae bacterium]
MRIFNYKIIEEKLMTPEIINMVTLIHEHKGKQELYIEANSDVLTGLLEIAKIQSIGASNRIEGIFTSDIRLAQLVKEKSEPRNQSEQEIAGYREVLATIHESYDYITPTANIILQLYRELYSFAGSSAGGSYKNADNMIVETDAKGEEKSRFTPVPAYQTRETMENLSEAYLKALNEKLYDPLIIIPMVILDFLCIHPFTDGNGRLSRLLTLLLLYREWYIVGKYSSLEMIIEKTKETYYEALQDSSAGWHEGENDYAPFVRYYLGVILNAYVEFESRVDHLKHRNLSKADCVKNVFDEKIGKVSKKEIMDICPDISETTIERTLAALLKEGYIIKVGAGAKTVYVKK